MIASKMENGNTSSLLVMPVLAYSLHRKQNMHPVGGQRQQDKSVHFAISRPCNCLGRPKSKLKASLAVRGEEKTSG